MTCLTLYGAAARLPPNQNGRALSQHQALHTQEGRWTACSEKEECVDGTVQKRASLGRITLDHGPGRREILTHLTRGESKDQRDANTKKGGDREICAMAEAHQVNCRGSSSNPAFFGVYRRITSRRATTVLQKKGGHRNQQKNADKSGSRACCWPGGGEKSGLLFGGAKMQLLRVYAIWEIRVELFELRAIFAWKNGGVRLSARKKKEVDSRGEPMLWTPRKKWGGARRDLGLRGQESKEEVCFSRGDFIGSR